MPNGVPMSWLRTSYDHLPLFVESAAGSRLRDVDGHEYADFNIADMSMFTGYGPAPVVEAVSRQVALGSQYLLPTEDSIWVAGELGRRYGLPLWQFTLAATSANTEVIRIARSSTGREKVLFFDGKYHGHFDDVLVELEDGRLVPEEAGLPLRRHRADTRRTVQRPRRPGARARRPRRGGGDHRTRADQQRRPPDAGRRLPRRAARDHPTYRHLAGLRRDAHAGRRPRRTHPDVGTRSRLRDGRQVDRRRHPAGCVRDDRGGGGRPAAARRSRRRQAPGRRRRHAVRQPGLDGGGARGDERGPHRRGLRPQPTPRWAAGGRAVRRRRGIRPGLDDAPVLAAERADVRPRPCRARPPRRSARWTCPSAD